MGKRNQQKRREKQRKRRASSGSRPTGTSGFSPGGHRTGPRPGTGRSAPGDVEFLVAAAALAAQRNDEQMLHDVVAKLVSFWERPVGGLTAPSVLGVQLEQALRSAWRSGWQPADLVRLVKSKLGSRPARLASFAISSQARTWRNASQADARWLAQLASLEADLRSDERQPFLPQWARTERLAASEALDGAVRLLSLLWHVPLLTLLGPPPDDWGRTGPDGANRHRPRASSLDSKMMVRVRALLAKAESTSFPEEADSLTSKAQELMARHAIDQAMLDAEGPDEEPAGRRLGVDDPYAAAKAILLAEVAEANRCRSVWDSELGFSTVFGYAVDLDVVEVLYTSLLVQGTTAMMAEGSAPAWGRRARSPSFRRSFLVAYAGRIGQRLRRSAATTVDEACAAHGDALLPVLAGRASDVDDACDEAFPGVRRFSVSANDHWGRVAGTVAADQASLALGPELTREVG